MPGFKRSLSAISFVALLAGWLGIALLADARAGEQPTFPGNSPVIRFPFTPVNPDSAKPVTPAAPTEVTTLNQGELYVIDSDDAFEHRVFPDGLVEIKKSGPRSITAKFAGGSGDYEDREFKGKQVVQIKAKDIKALPTGSPTESEILLVVRASTAKSGDDWVAKRIRVIHGPRPPPVVDPKVDPVTPKVDPVQPPVAKGLRVLFIRDKGVKLTPKQQTALGSATTLKYLNEKCTKDATGQPEWRNWDTSIDSAIGSETDIWQAIWKATKPKLGALPQVVIYTDQGGTAWPLPEDDASLLELLRKYGG